MKKYVHYSRHGINHFDKNVFRPVRNIQMRNKPAGGFWASPENSERSWGNWCEENDFCNEVLTEENKITFTLKEYAKVLEIRSVKELENLPVCSQPIPILTSGIYLDFEELAKKYDAIELLLSEEIFEGSINFMEGLYWSLYGWDCDSLLVMNPDIIVEEK